MKVKVIEPFRDKETKSILRPGQEIEITEERFSELTAGPLGIFVEEVKEKAPEKEPQTPGAEGEKKDKKTTKK